MALAWKYLKHVDRSEEKRQDAAFCFLLGVVLAHDCLGPVAVVHVEVDDGYPADTRNCSLERVHGPCDVLMRA